MSTLVPGFRHVDIAGKTDDKLREEARTHLARSPHLQVVAEILTKLSALALPWWSAERLRTAFPIAMRIQWLVERPDLRQAITHRLTGLAPRAARARPLASQAELIDAVIDSGDVDCATAEAAFEPRDIVVYGPVVAYWRRLRDSMPWDSDARPHQQLVAWMLRTMLVDRSEDGTLRKPVLSAWDVRTSIDNKTWQTRIPVEVRALIDDARLQGEKKSAREPFLARHELEIATPDIIAAHIPLRELQRVFIVAEKALGFEEKEKEKEKEKETERRGPPRPRLSPALDAQPTPCVDDIIIEDVAFEGLPIEAVAS